MQELRNRSNAIGSDNEKTVIHWMDCTKISGTDCYCDDDAQAEIKKLMHQALVHCINANAEIPGIHFFDNGNYHYMSKLWTDHVHEDFDLIVFDHHPDMQPPRFEGILSCGGWVKEVFDHNVHIKNAILIGIADHLVEEIQQDPTAEFEKYQEKVHFIKESDIKDSLGEKKIQAAFKNYLETRNEVRPIYISIDKDALCTNDVVTNWDQGSLTFTQLEAILHTLFASRKVIGVDICGERAQNQEYTEGLDEGSADARNNQTNANLFKLLQRLFQKAF